MQVHLPRIGKRAEYYTTTQTATGLSLARTPILDLLPTTADVRDSIVELLSGLGHQRLPQLRLK
jgi:hypothetical protein